MLEDKADARPRSIRPQLSIFGRNESVEEHFFYARMIMEVFNVPESRNGASDMHVKRRSAMSGQRTTEARRDGRAFKKPGESFAAGRIQLEDIDRLGLQHAPEVQ